jgi:hypothetical protein
VSISTFRTAVVRTPGGPDSIEIIDVPVVEPGPGEVRVGSPPRRSTPSTSRSWAASSTPWG